MLKLIFIATLILLFSCEGTENDYELNPDNIAGVLYGELTLDASVEYHLNGALVVEKGGVLNIPAGTKIVAEGGTSSYVGVARGGQIYARGTASDPIVFTADITEAGSWGGLVICGRAPSNLQQETSEVLEAEVSSMYYGGSDTDDNSGELSYVRVEYSGYNYGDEKQFNGFSFFGVGSQTIIENISSYESMDDGIEFFGGTVNAYYIASINSRDDGIDFTNGWQGTGSYWYAYNSTKSGVEGSNNENNGAKTPTTNAQLSHLTIYKMGERPWYLKGGAGYQNVDDIIIGGLVDNAGYAYFFNEADDKNTITQINNSKIVFTNVRFIDRGEGNDTNVSSNLKLDINDLASGAGVWSNDSTLEPMWASGWASPLK